MRKTVKQSLTESAQRVSLRLRFFFDRLRTAI